MSFPISRKIVNFMTVLLSVSVAQSISTTGLPANHSNRLFDIGQNPIHLLTEQLVVGKVPASGDDYSEHFNLFLLVAQTL